MTLLLLFLMTTLSFAVPPSTTNSPVDIQKDVVYIDSAVADPLCREFCKLDLYLPRQSVKFPLLVWFHGGGLNAGDKSDSATVGMALAQIGIGVVIPNYRLSPRATYPAYLQDAAQAVAWTKGRASKIGANPDKLFIGGHSAGGYLSAMLAMDPRYLQGVGVPLSGIAGFIPVSGQMHTHIAILAERGVGHDKLVTDEAAPMFYVRKETNRMLVMVADADAPGRAEDNYAFVQALQATGNTQVVIQTIRGRNHGSIVAHPLESDDPVRQFLAAFILTGTLPPAGK